MFEYSLRIQEKRAADATVCTDVADLTVFATAISVAKRMA